MVRSTIRTVKDRLQRLIRGFSKQPVGVRAALITAVALLPTLLAVEWYRAELDRRARAEERWVAQREALTAQLSPDLTAVSNHTVSIATTLRLGEEPDSASRDSLQILVEGLMGSMGGTGSRIAEVYGDSMGIRYVQMVTGVDSLFHALVVLWAADRERTAPAALDALREDIMQRALRSGRQSTQLLNNIIAGYQLSR